jgi:hypothetical protein
MAMWLISPAFSAGDPIPMKYTCDGEDVSPPLAAGDVPPGTQSFALLCEDPDHPVHTWTHWLLYNLPTTTHKLPEGVPRAPVTDSGAEQGVNDHGHLGYNGPCPPPGHGPHRYFFRLYALDTVLGLEPGATKAELLAAMEDHVLGEGILMGTYERQ